MAPQSLQTVTIRLHERTERLLRVESIERMQGEGPSRTLERAQVLLDHHLFKSQVPRAAVHNGRHVRLQQDIERVVLLEADVASVVRSEEHTSELQSRSDLVCRL